MKIDELMNWFRENKTNKNSKMFNGILDELSYRKEMTHFILKGSDNKVKGYVCAKCGRELTLSLQENGFNYCPYCGQKTRWEATND